MLDGVYVDGDEAPVFLLAPPLSDQDVQQIVQTSARRIIRLCTKRGLRLAVLGNRHGRELWREFLILALGLLLAEQWIARAPATFRCVRRHKKTTPDREWSLASQNPPCLIRPRLSREKTQTYKCRDRARRPIRCECRSARRS